MIKEEKIIDQIEIQKTGVIFVKEINRITKDNILIAETSNRYTFPPNSDISFMPENVKIIAKTVWTPEVVLKYEEILQSEK